MSKHKDETAPSTGSGQAVIDIEHPHEKLINGQKCDRVDSPLEDFPGCIYVVRYMSPGQFKQYWERIQDGSTDLKERLLFTADFYIRQHLVIEWHIEGIEERPDEHGQNLPAQELMNFVVAATAPAVKRATNLPNLPGWWPPTTTTVTSENGTAVQTPES